MSKEARQPQREALFFPKERITICLLLFFPPWSWTKKGRRLRNVESSHRNSSTSSGCGAVSSAAVQSGYINIKGRVRENRCTLTVVTRVCGMWHQPFRFVLKNLTGFPHWAIRYQRDGKIVLSFIRICLRLFVVETKLRKNLLDQNPIVEKYWSHYLIVE